MSVTKPAWTFVGTAGNNIWKGARQPAVAIVLHVMQGTLAACDGWFQNPAAQASSNFGIGKDGTIHCYVDPQGADAPYANGIVNGPDAAVQALLKAQNNVNPNWWSVSIEHEGTSAFNEVTATGTPFVLTAAQLAASTQLCAWLCDTFQIPADEDHILGHYEFDSATRAGCPGFDRNGWVVYENAVKALLQPQPSPTPPDPCAALEQQLAEAMGLAQTAYANLGAVLSKLAPAV